MLRVVIGADGAEAERLERLLANQPGVTHRHAPERQDILEAVAAWRPHLLVLDPDLDDGALAPVVADAGAHALAIAFLPPRRRERTPALLVHAPIGILPPAFDRGDVASLLAAARSEAELPPPSPPSRSRPAVEMLALGSVATAALIGFSLPGAPALLQGHREAGYYLAAILSLVALVALLGVRRPWAAAAQVALVGLVTLAPTQV